MILRKHMALCLLFLFLAMGFLPGCESHESKILVPYTTHPRFRSGNLYLLKSWNGNTELLLKYEEKKTSDSSYFKRYYHAYPEHTLNKITVVREIRQKKSGSRQRIYSVVVYDIDNRTSKVVYDLEVPETEIQRAAIYSPILGPDGKSLYFVMKENSHSPIEIISFNLQEGKIEKRVALKGSDKDFLLGNNPKYEKIRFGKERNVLYTDFWGIWKLNLENESIEQIWAGEKAKGKWVVKTSDGVLGKMNQVPEIDIKAIEALYGSKEFPVAMPIHGPDRRIYFYHQRKEGWFAKNRIGAYDKKEKKTHELKTTSRSIYAE